MANRIADPAQYTTKTTLGGGELLHSNDANQDRLFTVDTLSTYAGNKAIPPGYIDGLVMTWVNGTALTVTSGAAYIPSLSRVLRAPSDIAKTGLSLSASTWYHVYLFLNGSTPDIEIVTTNPSATYNGTSRSKSGDTSRRYIGSILTDSSGSMYMFLHSSSSSEINYVLNTGVAPFRVVSNGSASTPTMMNLSGLMPITADIGSFKLTNLATTPTVQVFLDSSGTTSLFNASAGQSLFCYSAAPGRVLYYAYAGAPSGSSFAYFDVRGYRFSR